MFLTRWTATCKTHRQCRWFCLQETGPPQLQALWRQTGPLLRWGGSSGIPEGGTTMIADAPGTPVLGMTPGQALETLHQDLGLTPKDLQAVLATTPRNVERWIHEQAHPQTKARQQLVQL